MIKEKLKEFGFEFQVEETEEILIFLGETPEIINVLRETKQEVSKIFDEFELHLDLYKDLEENYKTLNIVIISDISIDETIKKKQTF